MATLLIEPVPVKQKNAERAIPRLENGDHLGAAEFLRRYEAMPELKKAELAATSATSSGAPWM